MRKGLLTSALCGLTIFGTAPLCVAATANIEILGSARAIKKTKSGNFVVVGETRNNAAAWIATVDSKGKTLWLKTLDGVKGKSSGKDIIQTDNGDFVLAGYTGYIPSSDMGPDSPSNYWLMKLSEKGEPIWEKRLPGGHGESVIQTKDGGYLLGGLPAIIKFDKNGKEEWQKKFIREEPEGGVYSAYQDINGDFLVAGYKDPHAWVARLTQKGEVLWEHTDLGLGSAMAIRPINGGGHILAGIARSSAPSSEAYLVAQLDAKGQIAWLKNHATVGPAEAHDIQPTRDGGYIIVGSEWRQDSSGCWVARLKATGDIESSVRLGKEDCYSASSVREVDGGFVLAGSRMTPGGEKPVVRFLALTDFKSAADGR